MLNTKVSELEGSINARSVRNDDKYAADADTWAAHGETFGRAATLLFRENPLLYFPAAILGHHALEMLLKAALIRHGGFKVSKADGDLWGHNLVDLVTKLEGIVGAVFPDALCEAAKVFTDYFNELRYPGELKNVESLGGEDGLSLEYAIALVLPYARSPKNTGS